MPIFNLKVLFRMAVSVLSWKVTGFLSLLSFCNRFLGFLLVVFLCLMLLISLESVLIRLLCC
ncbi:hypothetical protein LINGRAPRIM_LOCUS3348 [Linum grandiflorum]